MPAGDREAAAARLWRAGQRASAVRGGEEEPHAGGVQAEGRTEGVMMKGSLSCMLRINQC